jgi:hypothetical protein
MNGTGGKKSRLLTTVLAIAIMVVGGLIGAVTTGLLDYSSAAASTDGGFVTSAATESTITISGSPTALPSEFWGANVRGYAPLGSQETTDWKPTGLQTAIWPGAFTGDGMDLIANRIYKDDGRWVRPGSSVSDFVSWCRSVGCTAVLQLPGEINDAGYTAREVSYVVNTLHFQPAYFEVGNEPIHWKHFGSSWSQWRSWQHSNASPTTYAQMLHRYIAAIRAVDPAAKFIGLPGIGTGAYHETDWIKATVQANGPDLAAVGIHVYPAGGHQSGTGSLSNFMKTLLGNSGISSRVPGDLAAIRSACSSCHIAIFVTEMGSGTMGFLYDKYIKGFPQVVYLSAEIAQGMRSGVVSLMPYSFIGTYPGSLFFAPTSPTHIDTLYTQIFSQLGPELLSTTLVGGSSLAYSIATYDPSSHTEALFLVNADPSRSLSLSLAGTPFTSRSVTESIWTSSTTKPVVSTHSGGLGSVSVGPVGLILLRVTGVGSAGDPGPGGPPGSSGAPGSASAFIATAASVRDPTLTGLYARMLAANSRVALVFEIGVSLVASALRGL